MVSNETSTDVNFGYKVQKDCLLATQPNNAMGRKLIKAGQIYKQTIGGSQVRDGSTNLNLSAFLVDDDNMQLLIDYFGTTTNVDTLKLAITFDGQWFHIEER